MPSIRVPDYTPSDRQTIFHQSEAFETMYGGAAGGGKTAAIVAEAITYGLKWPKSRIYIFRKTIPELKQSVVPEIYKQCADFINLGKGMTYNGQDRMFTMNNGTIIQLAYLETTADMYRYQSAEIHLLLIDELTHFTEEEYQFLKTRVRTAGNQPLKVMCGTNPGNIGHAWVKSYFIDITAPETIYTDSHGNSRMFVPAKISDHPDKRFRDTYTRQLSGLSDPNLRKAYLDGDWDIFAGQAFEEWRREKDGQPYHVITPFQIPNHWTKWFAYDWGYNTFAAGLWFAKDPATNRIYVYREFYEHAMTASKQAEKISMYSAGEGINMYLADPSLWKHIGNADTGETVAAIFERSKLFFQPANNDRKAGKNAVHEVLMPQADGIPGIQVFSNCVNFVRTFPNLPVDINKPEDIDTRAEDHLYDALRYGLMHVRPGTIVDPKIPEAALSRRQRYARHN